MFNRVILDHGGDPNQEDAAGCIPSFVAQKYGHMECYHILQHHINEKNKALAQQASDVRTNLACVYIDGSFSP